MDEYHFLADFFSSWRSMNDATKHIFIIGFYATIIIGLFFRYWQYDWLTHRQEVRRFILENQEALVNEREAETKTKAEKADAKP